MRRILLSIIAAAVAISFSACGDMVTNPANNANTTNTAAKPTPVAPTIEALVALETKAFEAWKNKDGKFFEGFLTDDFVMVGEDGRVNKAMAVKTIAEDKCDIKSFSFSDQQITAVGDDAAILTMKSTVDGTCDGQKMPAESWIVTVYVRSEAEWKAAYHNKVPVPDPNANPASPPAKSPADTKPTADAKPADTATETMLAIEKKGWEAWKNRDGNALGQLLAQEFVLIDPTGQRHDRAGALKTWTEPKCEITSFTLTDAKGVSLTKDAGLLTVKGNADGKCEGQALTPIWQTSLYVKHGETWKYVMVIESAL